MFVSIFVAKQHLRLFSLQPAFLLPFGQRLTKESTAQVRKVNSIIIIVVIIVIIVLIIVIIVIVIVTCQLCLLISTAAI